MKRKKRRKCRNCKQLFFPDYRNAKRQRHCQKPECRKAAKAVEKQRIYKVVDELGPEDRIGIYLPTIKEKCWYVFCADTTHTQIGGTSTVIVVSKVTGKVLGVGSQVQE